MRARIRRWITWFAGRSAADTAGVGGALGAIGGALASSMMTSGDSRLGQLTILTGLGAGLGSGGSLVAWSTSRLISTLLSTARVDVSDDLLDQFRTESLARIRSQWRVLLDGKDRLEAAFTGYSRIARPRSFHGSLRQRADLVGAVDAAASSHGGPRLLIVGPPGYGKTVALLDVAQHLTDGHDDEFGVPAVLNLGSWAHDDAQLDTWIVRELCATGGLMPGAEHVVRGWVAAGRIAPVLDGLDEITDVESRQRCVGAINAFLDRSPDRTALLVASRPGEYTEITARGADRLAVNAAITLGTLAPSRVVARLREQETEASDLLADLVATEQDKLAAQMLRVPLWLWLWIAGSQGTADAQAFRAAATRSVAEELLIGAYLDRTVASLAGRTGLKVATCRRLLASIAGFLAAPDGPDSTTFRLENLTPPHPSPAQTRAAAIVLGVPMGLLFGLVIALFLGTAVGILFGVLQTVVTSVIVVRNHRERWADSRPARSRIRWPGIVPLIDNMVSSFRHNLREGELLPWVAANLIKWIGIGIAGAAVLAPSHGLTTALAVAATAAGIGYLFWALTNFGGSLLSELMVISVVQGDTLDEGEQASSASLLLLIAIFGTGGGVVAGTLGTIAGRPLAGLAGGPIIGILFAIVSGRNFGGWYLLLQHRVRRLGRREALLPRDPVAFLNAGVEAEILRRTGGGVQFRHRLFLDHLAADAPAPGLMDLRRRFGTD